MKLDKQTLQEMENLLISAEKELLKVRIGDVSIDQVQKLILEIVRSSAYIALYEFTEPEQRSSI